MIICICHRVSDRDIARAARDGCASFDDLQIDFGVGTSCGKCHSCARQTFEMHASAAAAAARDTSVCFAHPQQATMTMAAAVSMGSPTHPAATPAAVG